MSGSVECSATTLRFAGHDLLALGDRPELDCFLRTDMYVLALGPWLVRKPEDDGAGA